MAQSWVESKKPLCPDCGAKMAKPLVKKEGRGKWHCFLCEQREIFDKIQQKVKDQEEKARNRHGEGIRSNIEKYRMHSDNVKIITGSRIPVLYVFTKKDMSALGLVDVINAVPRCSCGKLLDGKWDDCCSWECWNKKYH